VDFVESYRVQQLVTHDYLEELLSGVGSGWKAAQCHGLLCARLAVAGEAGAGRWFADVLSEADIDTDGPGAVHGDPHAECEAALDSLFQTTLRTLTERQSELSLLLPDDDSPRQERVAALAEWCHGFLNGLVSESRSEALKDHLSAEPLVDIIKDMVQISQAGHETDEAHAYDEEEEAAYVELVEYLRVAAQLAYEELSGFRARQRDDEPEDSTVLH